MMDSKQGGQIVFIGRLLFLEDPPYLPHKNKTNLHIRLTAPIPCLCIVFAGNPTTNLHDS